MLLWVYKFIECYSWTLDVVREFVLKSSFTLLLKVLVSLKELYHCNFGVQKGQIFTDAGTRTSSKRHQDQTYLLLTLGGPAVGVKLIWFFKDLFIEEGGSKNIIESCALLDWNISDDQIRVGNSVKEGFIGSSHSDSFELNPVQQFHLF